MSGKGISAFTDILDEYSENLIALSSTVKTAGGIWRPDGDSKEFLEEVDRVLNLGNFSSIFKKGAKKSIIAEVNTKSYEAYTAALMDGRTEAEATAAANEAAAKAIETMSNKMSEAANTAAGFATAVTAVLTVLQKIGAGGRDIFGQIEKSGRDVDFYLKSFFSTMSDFFGMFLDLSNLDFSSAFSKYLRLMNDVEYYDRFIEEQSDLLDDLEYQYQRLEVSIKKSFGSDYISNYNKQIEVLYAKQAAYEEQARLEREKGKASDASKIKEYEDNARAVGDQILDMQGQVAEFFSGTDLTSAAKDFASAWIEAYKEFGSTTDAMKEKFQDMIQEMIINSLAADIMQKQLKPVFDLVDTLAGDGALTASDIAQIAALANQVIPQANDALLNTMSLLNTAGYNIRQQPGQFTGIKRNIANATEESINGLTQATNVSNFYMAGIYNNVASILAVMTGGTTEQPNSGTQALFNNELALQYMSALPNIDQNIAELLRAVKSVISDKNSSTNLNVIAVRA